MKGMRAVVPGDGEPVQTSTGRRIGRPRNVEPTVFVSARVAESLAAALDRAAVEAGMSRPDAIRIAVSQWVRRSTQKESS